MDSITNKYLVNAQPLANQTAQAMQFKNTDVPAALQSAQSESNNSNKINKTLAALGILGVATLGVAIAALKSPKGKASDFSSAFKFFTHSNDEIQGAALKGGKALMQDGTPFSGIAETINKKGDKIKIVFQDGFMSEAYKNDKLYKTYDTLEGIPSKILSANCPKYSRTQGVKISLMEDNLPREFYYHIFDESGKVRRAVKYSTQKAFDALDIQDGAISAHTQIEKLFPSGKIYQDGAVSASISKEKGLNIITKYLDDGAHFVTGGKFEDYDLIMTKAADYKIKNPKFVKYYNPGDIVAQSEISLDKKTPLVSVLKGINRSDNVLRDVEIELPLNMNIPGKKLVVTLNENNSPYARAAFALKDGKPVLLAPLDKTKSGYLKSCISAMLNSAKQSGFDFDCDKVAQFLACLD